MAIRAALRHNAPFVHFPHHHPLVFTRGMHERAEVTTPSPTAARTSVAPAVLVAAAASVGAGLVHAAAAGTHTGADTVVRLFAITAALQVAWAALAVLRPGRVVIALGVALNGGAALAWALSRTQGLPWPAELEAIEDAGTQDVIAAALGAAAALVALFALARPTARAPRRGPTSGLALLAGGAALALAVPGMTASHAHGPSHEHDGGHGDAAVAAGDHGHGGGAAGHTDDAEHGDNGAAAATGPIISLDDPRVTDEQRAAAQSLIDSSQVAMSAYSDTASVEAAGYVSIGDGITGHEHFVNFANLVDGVEMDPARVESIVFEVAPDGTKQLVSAMYILSPGKTMANVPDIAGELTTWHDHQNLCWEGARVVGTTDATGTCQRGTFRSTPPMLHVWTVPHECGPFAGIDGSHGQGCDHSH